MDAQHEQKKNCAERKKPAHSAQTTIQTKPVAKCAHVPFKAMDGKCILHERTKMMWQKKVANFRIAHTHRMCEQCAQIYKMISKHQKDTGRETSLKLLGCAHPHQLGEVRTDMWTTF